MPESRRARVSSEGIEFTTLISVEELAACLDDVVVFDTRYKLADPGWGEEAYLEAHIPGARYAHLDRDLSGAAVPGETGRHPLPTVSSLVQFLRRAGLSNGVQIVIYDEQFSSIAARMWWMLKWLGHDKVAVVDGGWRSWVENEMQVSDNPPVEIQPGNFIADPKWDMVASAADVGVVSRTGRGILLDARSTERFLGVDEPIDPVAGHIPGAISRPWMENNLQSGYFRTSAELRGRFDEIAESAISYCGSGVTGAQNVLAMAHAGLPLPKLFVGSWSEWICQPGAPVALGDE